MYIIGDIHGQFDKLVTILQAADLIDGHRQWSAGDATLWFMGDYFDHGPDGVPAVELIIRLQAEAERAGGRVGAVIGNHEGLILAAHRFGERPSEGSDGTFYSNWLSNGGTVADLQRLNDEHIQWLISLPTMAIAEDRLLAHADATFYESFGRSIPAVNQALSAILQGDDPGAWEQLLDNFSQQRAFHDADRGDARLARILGLYGGRQFVHGHTPINKLTGQPPETITAPYVYAGGLAIDVDPGMYLGGPGFVAHLPKLEE
ncbi:MAG: metallophosphoesterase [Chloroflexota bacterium]|jgi:hypothetical protein